MIEVIEIDDHFVNRDTNVIEVSFRCMGDSDDEVRRDVIEYNYYVDYGYEEKSFSDNLDYEPDEWDEDEFEDWEDEYLDEDNLISFLNEYYTVYPKKLPKKESDL
jgi:hypothetical protein